MNSAYIKLLTNYLFIISSLSTFDLAIPKSFDDLPKYVGKPLDKAMSSIICVAKDIQIFPVVYFKLIFSLFFLFGYLFFCNLLQFIYIKIKFLPMKQCLF